MKRYLIRLSYIGTSYRGSQKHSNSNVFDIDSVQGAVESVFHKLYNEYLENPYPTLNLAGRTDSGVHALCTAAHIDLQHKSGDTKFNTEYMIRMVNRNLINCGHEIRIHSCHEVSKDFHARFSALSRTYLYRILVPKDSDNYKLPIAEMNRCMYIRSQSKNFDIERLKRGLELFNGRKDFKTFSAKVKHKKNPEKEKKSSIKTLNASLEESQPLMPYDPLSKNFNYWNLIFTSQSFMYNQIRRIVGTLISLSINTITEEHIQTMLQVPSHYNWNPVVTPALPHGLYLLNVEYDKELIKEIHS